MIKILVSILNLTFNKNICGRLMIAGLFVTASVEASIAVRQVVYDQLAAVLVYFLDTRLDVYR